MFHCKQLIFSKIYTAQSATDVMQVADFTGLIQVCHQVSLSLLASSL